MKALVCLTLAVCALASPISSFAQTASAPVTRAQVRAELLRLEEAGYNPSAGDEGNYPADIVAAEEKIAAEDAQRMTSAIVDGNTQTDSSHAGVSTGSVVANAK
jgi:hypothetical protein